MLLAHSEAVGIVGGGADLMGHRGADLQELFILERRAGDLCHIIGRHILGISVETRRILKMTLIAAQLRQLLVHHIHKRRDTSRHMLCQGVGRLIHRRKKKGVQAVLHRHCIADGQAVFIAAVRLHAVHGGL